MADANDTRGWVMAAVSGVACVFGASIICVDVLVRLLPGKRNFNIQDSNIFLSCSLSLSFGVMLFSALYGMLPSAKSYLQNGGFKPAAAQYILISLFLAGVIGIQLFSRLLHHYITSHVVDCDHTHHEEDPEHEAAHDRHHTGHHVAHHSRRHSHRPSKFERPPHDEAGPSRETTPLLSKVDSRDEGLRHPTPETTQLPSPPVFAPIRRPSMTKTLTGKVSHFMSGSKASCDEEGPCYGYSDPCGRECFKHVVLSNSGHPRIGPVTRHSVIRTRTDPSLESLDEVAPLSSANLTENHFSEDSTLQSESDGVQFSKSDNSSWSPLKTSERTSRPPSSHGHGDTGLPKRRASSPVSSVPSQVHHHHVPTNAFLSIGLQTSIAIALHKLPEGFITFATNHANPNLGFTVFVALFIHNITEGFAMALPLYLALNSRWKAMFWSSLLGGISQHLGAGLAALWFKLAGRSEMAPGEGIYGGMFAVTSGIMTSVALQLFSESLGLTHNRSLCVAFPFVGMGVLGLSFALTAG